MDSFSISFIHLIHLSIFLGGGGGSLILMMTMNDDDDDDDIYIDLRVFSFRVV